MTPPEDITVGLEEPAASQRPPNATPTAPFSGEHVSGSFVLRDGPSVAIRPIRPDDEAAMVRFHESLSDESVYLRYFHPLKLGHRIAHERLSRICHVDAAREMVLVAEGADSTVAGIVAVGRLTKRESTPDGEFAIVVCDHVQGQGLGTELLGRLVTIGREAGLARIIGEILPENRAMEAVAERVGFACRYLGGEGLVRAELVLEAPATR